MRTTYDWIIVLLLKVQIHINSSINFCKAEALRGIGSDYKKTAQSQNYQTGDTTSHGKQGTYV